MKKNKLFNKKILIGIAKKVEAEEFLKPKEVNTLLSFEQLQKDSKVFEIVKKLGLPLSIIFGLFIIVFPVTVEKVISTLPKWFELNPNLAAGLDYVWGIIGSPIEKTHLIYHMPNILLYSFGVFEIRNIINAIKKKSWLDKVLQAQTKLKTLVADGECKWDLPKGHSVLFVGNGDFIGREIAVQNINLSITLSNSSPKHTNVWNSYSFEGSYDELKNALDKSGSSDAGEFVFFPVIDTEIFLPSDNAYDLAPHKLDLLIQSIRSIESEFKWTNKRVIIIGDKYHQSIVETSGRINGLKDSAEILTLQSMTKRYPKVTLLDPTDITLQKILEISNGRKILFRASKRGLSEYKERFYNRIEELGYKENKSEKETLVIGYDLYEDQTEQQSISNRNRDYLPVVLSRDVLDSLKRNGYRNDQMIFVPELVIKKIEEVIAEQ